MAIPTAAISGAVTIVIVSWLFRLARRPVPTLPDGSIMVRYGRWMLAVGMLCGVLVPIGLIGLVLRSEEHTSELQSLRHLVCRLLLEKKKQHTQTRNT